MFGPTIKKHHSPLKYAQQPSLAAPELSVNKFLVFVLVLPFLVYGIIRTNKILKNECHIEIYTGID